MNISNVLSFVGQQIAIRFLFLEIIDSSNMLSSKYFLYSKKVDSQETSSENDRSLTINSIPDDDTPDQLLGMEHFIFKYCAFSCLAWRTPASPLIFKEKIKDGCSFLFYSPLRGTLTLRGSILTHFLTQLCISNLTFIEHILK